MNRPQSKSVLRMTGVLVIALALLAGACGKKDESGSGGTTTTTTGTTSGTTTGGGSGSTVEAKSVGSLGMVLVDSRGLTLYHLTGETASKFTCTGGCVDAWPPLEASGTPSGGSGATGTISTAMRPDGISQVTYDGLPLYTFSGDSKPGDANGQGVQGAWFAVTPDGKDAGAGSGSGGTTGGGYPGY